IPVTVRLAFFNLSSLRVVSGLCLDAMHAHLGTAEHQAVEDSGIMAGGTDQDPRCAIADAIQAVLRGRQELAARDDASAASAYGRFGRHRPLHTLALAARRHIPTSLRNIPAEAMLLNGLANSTRTRRTITERAMQTIALVDDDHNILTSV